MAAAAPFALLWLVRGNWLPQERALISAAICNERPFVQPRRQIQAQSKALRAELYSRRRTNAVTALAESARGKV
jgi:hypothetical protein